MTVGNKASSHMAGWGRRGVFSCWLYPAFGLFFLGSFQIALAEAPRDPDCGRDLEKALDLWEGELKEALPPERADALYDDVVQRFAGARSELATLTSSVSPGALVPWDCAGGLVEALKRAGALRAVLLPRLSSQKRSAVHGSFTVRWQELRDEAELLQVSVQHYQSRRFDSESLLAELKEAGIALLDGSHFWILCFAAMLAVYAVRRKEKWLSRISEFLKKQIHERQARRTLMGWLRLFSAVFSYVAILLFFYYGRGLMEEGDFKALASLCSVFIALAWYGFGIRGAQHVLTTRLASSEGETSARLQRKAIRTLRMVGLYGFGAFLLLVTCERALGRGQIYGVAATLAWFGFALLGFLLVNWWKNDIANSYLAHYSHGRFARAVERTRGRPSGFFVALVAFGAVAARAGGLYVQSLLLRFNQARKALAFLSRRKMEKQAETIGYGVTDISLLHEKLQQAFSEEPVEDALAIDCWPHFDDIMDRISHWKSGELGQAVALVGHRGMGKTSLIRRVRRHVDELECLEMTLEERYSAATDVYGYFGAQLGLNNCQTQDDLVCALKDGPKRLILMDHGQNLMLRAMGGMRGYEAFADLVALTTANVFWVITFSQYAWQHLQTLYSGANLFRSVFVLAPWSEEQIGQLLDKRMKWAGFEANYDDLVVDDEGIHGEEDEAQRTSDRYRRLLWDYSDGNPRVALHFWLRSLVPDTEAAVRVRLFAAPSPDELESLGEQSRFVLAAVAAHANLSLKECSRVLGYSINACESTLAYLVGQDLLSLARGRYRLEMHRSRAVLRYLHRKYLLHS